MKLAELFESISFKKESDHFRVIDSVTRASAKIVDEGDIALVTSIETPKVSRGSGGATAVMNAIISYADKKNKKLRLNVVPDDDTDQDRLIKFYERFGFKKTRNVEMTRDPK